VTRHLAAPLRLSDAGSLVTLPQDSPQEIAQSVALLVATRPGERRSEPAYGSPAALFAGRAAALDLPAAQLLLGALSTWEPRADPAALDITMTGDPTVVRARVTPGAGVDVI
jgi:phage baseplate assembly protein W